MSIHDETWDKCRWCKQTVKTWHGDFHDLKICLIYPNWNDYNRRFETMNNNLEKKDDSKIGYEQTCCDKDYEYDSPESTNWELMAKRLWGLLDDIDTAFDHYNPNMNDKFVNYVDKKCRQRQEYMISLDGQTLSPLEIPIIEDLDPMCRWFKDAWRIEKQRND